MGIIVKKTFYALKPRKQIISLHYT